MQLLTGGMRTLRVPALLVVAWVVGLATATAQEGHCPGLPVPAWGAVVTRPCSAPSYRTSCLGSRAQS
jgi:hypothetical protein